mgnify:CR=1 FL=1
MCDVGSFQCADTLCHCVPTQVANLDSFDVDRTISLVPPDGEFALMNYRCVCVREQRGRVINRGRRRVGVQAAGAGHWVREAAVSGVAT